MGAKIYDQQMHPMIPEPIVKTTLAISEKIFWWASIIIKWI